jgi:hypothetical protein
MRGGGGRNATRTPQIVCEEKKAIHAHTEFCGLGGLATYYALVASVVLQGGKKQAARSGQKGPGKSLVRS